MSLKLNAKQSVKLPVSPPFNWKNMMDFLHLRAIPGVETIKDLVYSRSIEIQNFQTIISIKFEESKNQIVFDHNFPGFDLLSNITGLVENFLDLSVSSLKVDKHLKKDRHLKKIVEDNPGIRVPGCFDSFELSIRAIIGQQISVKGATTIIGRIAKNYGKKLLQKNNIGLEYIFPGPEALANAKFDNIGLTKRRRETINDLSKSVLNKEIPFDSGSDPEKLRNALIKIKGIGDWTAQYITMRTIKDPDAFPVSDLGLLKAAGKDSDTITKKSFEKMAKKWKPYRAYAAMYLWSSL